MANNQNLAKIFYELAQFLEMDDVAFKPFAYEKAALALENLSEDISSIYKKEGFEGLKNIPGVGESIAEKIEEYLKTGKIKYYEEYKKKYPMNIEELTAVEGIGPKMVKMLWKELKIKNLKDLETAAKAGKIRNLFRFGEKTEQNILQGINFLKRERGRFLLGEILPVVKEIINSLKSLKEIKNISEAGSVRRRKETIGDVDILTTLKTKKDAEKIIDFFVNLPGIEKIWAKGPTKASVRRKEGFDVDLRVVSEKSYGSALQYFTGSKEHNISLRQIAIDKGLKLNEYGLFKSKKMIAGKTEEEIYKKLGMDIMEPELRENTGEIEAAIKGKLPKIIKLSDIKGDLHVHSNWDGGENSIEEIAKAAINRDYEYIGVADHTKFLRVEHGLNEKQLLERNKQIEKLNKKLEIENYKLKILTGCEANIMPDGSIDIKDEVLKKLDYAIAGVHSQFKMSRDEMTKRIITAMKNPNIDIISHPTGRIIQKRDEYQIDFDKILKAAKATNTILEINSFPERLDLKDVYIKKAKEAGVKMIINTDAHHIDQLRFMEYGVFQARRGWAEKEDIINTKTLSSLLKFLRK